MDSAFWLSPSRYYAAQVQRNLFGEWELYRVWGGRGSRRGGAMAVPAASREEAIGQLQLEMRRRAARGYTLCAESGQG